MKKVLLMLAEGFETLEALSVKDVCARAGVCCTLVGVMGKVVTTSHGIKVEADIEINEVDFNDYDALIIPGGLPGAYNLRDDEKIVSEVENFYNDGKIVAAICAGPIVFYKAGILEGKTATSNPGFKDKIGNVNYKEEPVVVDGNIITSRGPATAIEFGLTILKELGYKEKSEELSEAMLVNYYKEFYR
ncbi:MAG: DJ-1 family glyoxalase III [Sarcina sp.]